MTALTALEHVVRRSAVAVEVRDLTTGVPLSEGVVVTAWRPTRPHEVFRAGSLTAAGVGGFTSLPGLRTYEDGSTARADWFDQPPQHAPVPYVVRVEDRTGAHLPALLAVDAPQAAAIDVALPPSPTSPVPGGWMALVATLEDPSGAPAAWAVVELDVAGYATGGVTNADGLVVVGVPRATAPSSTGTPASGPQWTVDVTVRFRPGDHVTLAGAWPGDPPSLDSIHGQQAASVQDNGAFVASLVRRVGSAGAVLASTDPPQPPAAAVLIVRPNP